MKNLNVFEKVYNSIINEEAEKIGISYVYIIRENGHIVKISKDFPTIQEAIETFWNEEVKGTYKDEHFYMNRSDAWSCLQNVPKESNVGKINVLFQRRTCEALWASDRAMSEPIWEKLNIEMRGEY